MRKLYIFPLVFLLSVSSFSQTVVIVDAVNVTNYDARSTSPILLTVKRSRFSNGTNTTMLLVAGDDTYVTTRDNNMDGAKIIGNKFEWTGYASYPGSILHGVLLGMNKNQVVKHNYVEGAPYSFVYKASKKEPMESTKGGHSYNIHRNSKALNIKGMSGVKLYNNTFYNTRYSNFYNIHVYENSSSGETMPYNAAKNVKIKNNIIYQKYDIPAIQVDQTTCLQGFESDYNIFWCEDCDDNKPSFKVAGVTKTWEQWRAMGYDTHSRIMNPDFNDATYLVPAARMDYGTNLGAGFEYGLATTARWSVGQYPDTVRQNGAWQVGAVIYAGSSVPVNVTGITVTGAGGASTITTDNGTLQLSAAVTPSNATNKTVTWSVVNGTGQASISTTGLVTAIANGSVTARATANDGSAINGTLLITISNQATGISVTGVIVNPGTTTLNIDDTHQLTETVLPSNASNTTVSWSSGNTAVAQVDATGLVEGVTVGSATITATTQDGGFIDTSVITVVGESSSYNLLASVTSATLRTNRPGEFGMKFTSSVAGQITKIRYLKPTSESGAHVGRLWSASGSQLASASFSNETSSGWQEAALSTPYTINANTTYVVSVNSNGGYYSTVYGLQSAITNGPLSSIAGSNGVYVYTVGAFPNRSYQNTNYFRDITFNSTSAIGMQPENFVSTIEDNETKIETVATSFADDAITVFPNPASRYLSISINDPESQDFELSLYNSLSRKVISRNTSETLVTLNVEEIPKGIYILFIRSGQKLVTKKVIIE